MKVVRRGSVVLHDYEPKQDFAADVTAGLSQDPPSIPSKYLYDAAGSRLFERICELPEYYPTRTELAIMEAHIAEMAAALGPRCALIEPGAGSGVKTRLLLSALDDPVAYIPLDISRRQLLKTAQRMAADFAPLEVAPVCTDYFGDWELPPLRRPARRNVVYFPGSTIGNMESAEAEAFLRRMAQICRTSRERVRPPLVAIKGQGAVPKARGKTPAAINVSHAAQPSLLVGVDLRKDPAVIAAAYNDVQGVTRDFNLNLVARLNRELGAAIDPAAIEHLTYYNEQEGRNESYLVAVDDLRIAVDGHSFSFPAGTRILVEHSYKYSLEGFAELATRAGLTVARVWTDPQRWFSVQYLTAA